MASHLPCNTAAERMSITVVRKHIGPCVDVIPCTRCFQTAITCCSMWQTRERVDDCIPTFQTYYTAGLRHVLKAIASRQWGMPLDVGDARFFLTVCTSASILVSFIPVTIWATGRRLRRLHRLRLPQLCPTCWRSPAGRKYEAKKNGSWNGWSRSSKDGKKA